MPVHIVNVKNGTIVVNPTNKSIYRKPKHSVSDKIELNLTPIGGGWGVGELNNMKLYKGI